MILWVIRQRFGPQGFSRKDPADGVPSQNPVQERVWISFPSWWRLIYLPLHKENNVISLCKAYLEEATPFHEQKPKNILILRRNVTLRITGPKRNLPVNLHVAIMNWFIEAFSRIALCLGSVWMRLLHGRLMVAKDNPGSRFCVFTIFQEAMTVI